MSCPPREELAAALQGRLPAAPTTACLQHAEACETCRGVIGELEGASDQLTKLLTHHADDVEVSQECERMIDEAERLVGDDCSPPCETVRRHLLQGTRVRDYEIIRPLGGGGMGDVFLARHVRLGHDVALKVLSLRRIADAAAERRFDQETAILGALRHPGIVRALDAGEFEGVQYLVMERIDGINLRQLSETLGPIPVADACEICRQAAVALDYAHQRQMIHRDVKPSNIMLAVDGTVRILDMGLARWADHQRRRITPTDDALGSLDFMAPEQLNGESLDHRADVYGLGSTLYFLLRGEPPRNRRTASLMVNPGPRHELLVEGLPSPLSRLLRQMLASDPRHRVASAHEAAKRITPLCRAADLRRISARAAALLASQDAPAARAATVGGPCAIARHAAGRRRIVSAVVGILAVIVGSAALQFVGRGTPKFELSKVASVTSREQPARELPLFQVHEQAVRCITYCETTSQLVCGSDDATVSIRDLPSQSCITIVGPFRSAVVRVSVADVSRRLLCLDGVGTLAVLELPSGRVLRKVSPDRFAERVIEALLLTDGEHVVLSDDEGVVRLWAWRTDSVSAALPASDESMQRLLPAENDENFISCEGRGAVRLRSVRDLHVVDELASLSPGDVFLVAAGRDRWESISLGGSRRLQAYGPTTQPFEMVLHDKISLLDMRRPETVYLAHGKDVRWVELGAAGPRQFSYQEHECPVTAVRALPHDSFVATADESGQVRIWSRPGEASSDWLSRSGASMDSSVLSEQRNNETTWSRAAFDGPADGRTLIEEQVGGGMVLSSRIERDGQEHVLEYRIDP